MKAINTMIISSLLVLSIALPVSATDFAQHTADMNEVLQKQIDTKIHESLQQKARTWSPVVVEEFFGSHGKLSDNGLTDATS